MKDEVVIEKIKKGDETAIEYLYKQNYRMMVNLIKKNNGSEDEAKDIYQDALVIFWEKVANNEFKLTSRISTYLYSICNNLWRKELNRKSKFVSEEDTEKAQEYNIDANEQVKAIHRCISKLGDTCQKVLTMYYFDKISMTEIAEKLNFSNSDTAKTKKYKCKKELDTLVLSLYKASDFLD